MAALRIEEAMSSPLLPSAVPRATAIARNWSMGIQRKKSSKAPVASQRSARAGTTSLAE